MRYLILLLTSLYAINGLASEVGYDVEVIVFQNNNQAYKNTENWRLVNSDALDSDNEPVATSDSGSKQAKKTPNAEIKMLPQDKYQLTNLATKIQSNSDYTLLYHAAWSQPGLDEQHAINFHTRIPYALTPEKSTDSGTGPEIDANFKLVMSRYLHFNIDMLIPLQLEPADSDGNQPNGADSPSGFVEFKEQRRMRSREIHYIDHPLVGIIVLATPFKITSGKDKSGAPGGYQTL